MKKPLRHGRLRSMRSRLIGAALVLQIGAAADSHAQVAASGPAATALAGGGAAYVYGADAIFRNPANLALDTYRLVEVVIGQAGVSVGGNLLQFRHYNTLFTGGRTLSDEEAQRVVDDWFGGIGALGLKSAGVAVEAVPAAVVHEVAGLTMGYGIRLRTLSRVGINGGWLDLLLSGTGEDRSIPLHGELGVMATTEISVAVARMARDGALAIGVSPKLILGNEFIDATLRSTAHVANDAIAHDFEYRVRAAGGLSADLVDEIDFFSSGVFAGGPFRPRVPPTTGLGAGIDAGVTFLPSPGIKLSASVTDLGFVRWSSDAQSIEPLGDRFTFQGLEFDIDRVRDEFGGDVGKYFVSTIDSLASGAYDRVDRTYGAFLATLPTTVHFGASWVSPAGRLVVAGGTSTPITPSTVQISTPPEIHAGLEYTLGDRVRVPLRAGLFLGGSSALVLGLGFGLHTSRYDIDIGLAASPRTDIAGAGGRYSAAVSAVTFRF